MCTNLGLFSGLPDVFVEVSVTSFCLSAEPVSLDDRSTRDPVYTNIWINVFVHSEALSCGVSPVCFPLTHCSEGLWSLGGYNVGVHCFPHNMLHCSSPKACQRALWEDEGDVSSGGVMCQISLERMEDCFLF